MAAILAFFCLIIQISPTNQVLELNFQKRNVTQVEANLANLNVDKIILKPPPFLNRVYG